MTQAQTNKDWAISLSDILADEYGYNNDAAIKQGLPAEFAASAEDIQTDASGNVYIAGNAWAVDPNRPWASEQNLGPFVSKFSSDGSEVWTKTFQDPDVYLSSGHYGSPLDVSDNGTVALAINERLDYQQSSSEYFNGNGNGSENKGVLLKLDGADGSTVKEYVLDSGGSQALTTAISNAGDIYIVSGVDGGAYQQFIGRYTDTGKLWEVPIGIGARDAYSLNDSVMVNGIDQGGIIAEYSAESGALLSTISRGASVNAIDVSNGAIAVAGAEQLLNEAIGFVGLYDNQSQSNQGPKWVDTQNHPGWDEYLDVDFLENGNIVALGQTWWGPGAITEYDSDGDILWNPDLYPLQNDYQRSYAPYEIEVGDGNIYFLGIDDGNGRWGGKLGSTSDLHTILDAKSPPNTILDILEGSDQSNIVVIDASGSGSVDGTPFSNVQSIDLKGGDDTATIDLLNPATAVRSLLLNGGDGNDVLDIKLSDQEFAELEDTDALMQLGSYLSDPTGKTLDIAFGDFTLNAIGFESATFNHVIPTDDQPPEAPTLNSVAASASDTTSASGLEGLNLDVGGAANVQAPVTLKSTSDASTVEGNVKSDAHATDVLGISTSTLHAASDLSVGSALQSIVSGSAESTSGIAIANALVDTQHGIDLTNPTGADALASGGSSTVISTSSLTATSTAQTVGDGISDSGPRLLDGAWANTIAEDHLGLGSTGVLTLDSESNSTVSTSMVSKLTSTATANDGLAVATSQLLSSTGIENLNAEVGGLGLVTAVNQGVFKADATSTTDDASALGINEASAGILDSTFTFGITDSTITAKDFNSLQVTATSTGSDAWSKLQSSSTGIADLSGIENRITDAGTISAIASDQGFAHSATVSGTSTAFASQEAIGMSGYEVSNHSDLTLSAQALVSSESNSSAVGV